MMTLPNHFPVGLIAACVILALAGCDRAASPDAVRRDVALAHHDAQVADTKAAERADARVATAAYDMAVTEAEGVHRVAIAACAGKPGALQKACRDQADATLSAAKAYARASLAQLN